jgi:hypothetical protein
MWLHRKLEEKLWFLFQPYLKAQECTESRDLRCHSDALAATSLFAIGCWCMCGRVRQLLSCGARLCWCATRYCCCSHTVVFCWLQSQLEVKSVFLVQSATSSAATAFKLCVRVETIKIMLSSGQDAGSSGRRRPGAGRWAWTRPSASLGATLGAARNALYRQPPSEFWWRNSNDMVLSYTSV